MSNLLAALVAKYNGDVMVARANLSVYQNNPAGIGDHPDIIGAMDMEVEKLASAEEKLQTVLNLQKDDNTFLQD
jgi:hypothetical protein